MRQAADILSSKPAMQIRYLEAMQAMAKSAGSKVIFMPSASGLVQGAGKDDDLSEGVNIGPTGEPSTMFNITDPGFQQAVNASIIEHI
jgi:erythrocyte band 7 integral membrane protein